MYKREALPQFVTRWRITGQIRTESPMHIGDGNNSLVSARDCETKSLEGADPRYATIFTGADRRPVVPATSMKGALRAWAMAHGLEPELVVGVFGSQDIGGIVTFRDATIEEVPEPADSSFRFWSRERSTGLSPQVVIDPGTRSAEEGLLYYVEYVPAGAVFSLSLTAQNATERQRGLLLYVLENAFRSEGRPARLGSQIANGWGRVNWSLRRIEAFDSKAWIQAPPTPWQKFLRPLGEEIKAQWLTEARRFQDRRAGGTVRLKLRLEFQGGMLVNDPTRCRKANSRGEGAVAHAMIRREDNSIYLPARSVRGALRAQVRRIWQTLAWHNREQNARTTDKNEARRSSECQHLAGFFKLMGSAGWRSPIEVRDFDLNGEPVFRPQEFVAVDRFTGGAAAKRKFNAHGLWEPDFTGIVTIRADRWGMVGVGTWGWLLLAFTLRDWMEGDCSIGFGRAKGYGSFIARCEVEGASREANLLRGILQREAAVLTSPELEEWGRSLVSILAPKPEEAA